MIIKNNIPTDETCQCDSGFHGKWCQESGCPDNCSGNGVCQESGICRCNSQFRGSNCNITDATVRFSSINTRYCLLLIYYVTYLVKIKHI